MKKLVLTAVAAAALAIPAGAAADPASDAYCGASTNGCDQAFANTDCAGHGAFGAFGPGNDWRGGADGQLTGYFNSALCGNGNGGTAP